MSDSGQAEEVVYAAILNHVKAARDTEGNQWLDGAVQGTEAVLAALRALPVAERMEAMGMVKADPFETFTAGDGMRSIRGRTDVWAEESHG